MFFFCVGDIKQRNFSKAFAKLRQLPAQSVPSSRLSRHLLDWRTEAYATLITKHPNNGISVLYFRGGGRGAMCAGPRSADMDGHPLLRTPGLVIPVDKQSVRSRCRSVLTTRSSPAVRRVLAVAGLCGDSTRDVATFNSGPSSRRVWGRRRVGLTQIGTGVLAST